MAVIYNHFESTRPGIVRSYCIRCGDVILSPAFQSYCLDCGLKGERNARDNRELSQDSCKQRS